MTEKWHTLNNTCDPSHVTNAGEAVQRPLRSISAIRGKGMRSQLKLQYIISMAPAILVIFSYESARLLGMVSQGVFAVPGWAHRTVFILAAVTGLAGPLFARTWFAHTHRSRNGVAADIFYRFQKQQLLMALATPYLAMAAVICEFPRFYAGAIVLMALYAGYYYYPSSRRINFDKKMFRVI